MADIELHPVNFRPVKRCTCDYDTVGSHALSCQLNKVPFIAPANMVEHPPHYNQGKMEAIDIIEAVGFGYHLSNALKYLIRSPYKGHEDEDLAKAIWYIERYRKLKNEPS